VFYEEQGFNAEFNDKAKSVIAHDFTFRRVVLSAMKTNISTGKIREIHKLYTNTKG